MSTEAQVLVLTVEAERLRQENDRLRAENSTLRPLVSELQRKVRLAERHADHAKAETEPILNPARMHA